MSALVDIAANEVARANAAAKKAEEAFNLLSDTFTQGAQPLLQIAKENAEKAETHAELIAGADEIELQSIVDQITQYADAAAASAAGVQALVMNTGGEISQINDDNESSVNESSESGGSESEQGGNTGTINPNQFYEMFTQVMQQNKSLMAANSDLQTTNSELKTTNLELKNTNLEVLRRLDENTRRTEALERTLQEKSSKMESTSHDDTNQMKINRTNVPILKDLKITTFLTWTPKIKNYLKLAKLPPIWTDLMQLKENAPQLNSNQESLFRETLTTACQKCLPTLSQVPGTFTMWKFVRDRIFQTSLRGIGQLFRTLECDISMRPEAGMEDYFIRVTSVLDLLGDIARPDLIADEQACQNYRTGIYTLFLAMFASHFPYLVESKNAYSTFSIIGKPEPHKPLVECFNQFSNKYASEESCVPRWEDVVAHFPRAADYTVQEARSSMPQASVNQVQQQADQTNQQNNQDSGSNKSGGTNASSKQNKSNNRRNRNRQKNKTEKSEAETPATTNIGSAPSTCAITRIDTPDLSVNTVQVPDYVWNSNEDNTQSNGTLIYFDTCADISLSPHRHLLSNVREVPPLYFTGFNAQSKSFSSNEVGTLIVEYSNGVVHQYDPIYVVPNAYKTLIGQDLLADNNSHLRAGNERGLFFADTQDSIPVDVIRNSSCLRVRILHMTVNAVLTDDSLHKAHLRYLLGPKHMKQISSYPGYLSNKKTLPCTEGCHLASFRRPNVLRGPNVEKSFNLCLDVIGPFQPAVGTPYTCAIVGYHVPSRTSFIHASTSAITSRDVCTLLAKIIKFLRRHMQTNSIDLTLRSDGGTYFRSKQVLEFLCDYNIDVSVSAALAPETNGVIERHIGVLKRMMHSMQSHARLPEPYWYHALMYASWMFNLLPSQKGEISSWEYIYGRVPDISLIKVFGTLCTVQDKTRAVTTADTARAGLFLGYSPNHTYGCAVVKILSTNRLVYTIDLRHAEDVFPMRLSPDELQMLITSSSPDHSETMRNPSPTPVPAILEDPDNEDEDSESTGSDHFVFEDNDSEPNPANDTVSLDPNNSSSNSRRRSSRIPQPRDFLEFNMGADSRFNSNANRVNSINSRPKFQKTAEPSRWTISDVNLVQSEDPHQYFPADAIASTVYVRAVHQTLPTPVTPDELLRRTRVVARKNLVIPASIQGVSIKDEISDENGIRTMELKIPLPKNYNQVTKLPDEWQELYRLSMSSEYHSLLDKDVFNLISKDEVKFVTDQKVPSMWIFAIKRNGLIKSRIVALGNKVPYKKNQQDLYSPTSDDTYMRLILGFAQTYSYDVSTLDVPTAFLNSKLLKDSSNSGKTVVVPPQPLDRHLLFDLKKALYGLRQSCKSWFLCLKDFLSEIGLYPLSTEGSVFVLRRSNSVKAMLLVHVDDILIASDRETTRYIHEAFTRRFSAKIFTEAPFNFLGVTIDRTDKGWILNQSEYIDQILASEGMTECNIQRTPMKAKLQLSTPEHRNQIPEYRSILGKLGYLRLTRPDLAFVLSILGKYSQGQDEEHLAAIKHVLRYLKGTRNLSLHFEFEPGQEPSIVAFSDATWKSHKDTFQSQLGYIIFFNGIPVVWKSQKIKRLVKSSTESEAIALDACTEAIENLRAQLTEMGFNFTTPTIVYTDNEPIYHVVRQDLKLSPELMRIGLKVNLLRERVKNKVVDIQHLKREFNHADAMCKVEGRVLFESAFTKIYGCRIYDTEKPVKASKKQKCTTNILKISDVG